MKASTLILFQFVSVFSEDLKIVQTFKNVQEQLDEIKNNVETMHKAHPDPELVLLQMFDPIVKEIENFTISVFVENSLIQIADEYEYVLNPVNKLQLAKSKVDTFYEKFEKYVKKEVFVDEVVLDEWLTDHDSESNMEKLHEIFVPEQRSDSLPYKLYLALWYQVI